MNAYNEVGSVLEMDICLEKTGSLLWFDSGQVSKNGILVMDAQVMLFQLGMG